MTALFWKDQLDRCPAIRPWLERAAHYAVTRKQLPATLTLGPVPENKAVRQILNRIFNTCAETGGRLKVRLEEERRDPVSWRPLAEALGLPLSPPTIPADESPEALLAQTLLLLKVNYPSETALIEALRRSDTLRRYFRMAPSAPDDLLALFEILISLRTTPAGVTLSELGAKGFNDSKALRGGPLRQQLEHLLRIQSGSPGDDAVTLFNACGIIENPYTTHVVVFAPFSYRTHAGDWLDWPYRLWQQGEAAILSWKTVRALTSIRFETPCPALVTSENAAPFHRLVEMRRAALYTEGYPNAAVKTLLRHFAQAKTSGLHWGDTDLDGYRIAEQVARNIPTRLYVPPAAADHLLSHLLPLSAEQRHRLEQFIAAHPDFPYLAELRDTLARGWLEQEQTIDGFG